MDLKLIKALVRIMKGGDVSELELEDSNAGTRVRIRRGPEAGDGGNIVNVMPGGSSVPVHGGVSYSSAPPQAVAGEDEDLGLAEGTQEVLSPMVGTFYLAASPESEPFVEVGARISLDSTICIIEAMKVMNEIKAEISGVVLEILVENGEPVEHGQPLFLVKTG